MWYCGLTKNDNNFMLAFSSISTKKLVWLIPSYMIYLWANCLALFLTIFDCSSNLFIKTHLLSITYFPFVRGIRSHTFILWNRLSSSCIAIIKASSPRSLSKYVGSIIEIRPTRETSFLKDGLVLIGSFLFPIIWSSGCDDLSLKLDLAGVSLSFGITYVLL